MKALLKRPGFEAIFTLVILLMVVLPAIVYAQQGYKYLAIIVKNGDTTVNGKKISSLSPNEKAEARKAFGQRYRI